MKNKKNEEEKVRRERGVRMEGKEGWKQGRR